MPVPIMLKSGSSTTSLKLDHQYSGQVFWVKSDVTVDSVFIDPEYWILAKERLVTKSSYQDEGSNAMTVFPNPTNNKTYLTIKDPTEKQLQIRLFNTVGQTLIELTVTTEGKNETIQLPTDKLSKGVYWIKTWNGKENRTFQLVRE
jgi:hypothetical protein